MGQCGSGCLAAIRNAGYADDDDEGTGVPMTGSQWQRVATRRSSFDDGGNDSEGSPELGPNSENSDLRRRLKRFEDLDFLRAENKDLKQKMAVLARELAVARGEAPPADTAFDDGALSHLDLANTTDVTLEMPLNGGEELPEPLSEEDQIRHDVNESVKELVNIVEGKGNWKKAKEKGGIVLYTCEIPGTTSLGVKVVTTFEFTAQQTFETLMDPSTKLGESDYKIMAELEDDFRVTHTRVPIPLFSDSDFCCGEWAGTAGEALVYAFCSVKYGRCPPTKKSIRGQIVVGGWHMVPVSKSSCQVTMVSVCDPCRNLPSALAQSTAEKSGKSMVTMKKLVQKRLERVGQTGQKQQHGQGAGP